MPGTIGEKNSLIAIALQILYKAVVFFSFFSVHLENDKCGNIEPAKFFFWPRKI